MAGDSENSELLQLIGYHVRNIQRDWPGSEFALFPRQNVCHVCCGSVEAIYSTCYACNKRERVFGGELADIVVPLSYAVRAHPVLQQFYFDLHNYKSARCDTRALIHLTVLAHLFRVRHLACLENRIGLPVKHVIAVPSGRNRPDHPLVNIAQRFASEGSGVSFVPACFVGQPRTGRAQDTSPDDFRIDEALSGHVMIVEDTWVQGHNAQGLAVQARRAGAEKVSVVVLARLLDYRYPPTKELVDTWADDKHFDPYLCPVTGERHS
ncbi:hypothetical protein [Trueperella sp. LYQ141]|uniref:hypothetical protein n=1 Tax=Trueperella sp. LYQ141 TaxID=3391058 RepID=UPI003983088E